MPPFRILLLIAVFAASAPDGVRAEGACEQERAIGVQVLDEPTWKRLNAINDKLAGERYPEARADLLKMLEREPRNPYLEAVLNQALGQVEWALGNQQQALGHFERAVDRNALPDPAHYGLLYRLAQMYYLEGRYDDSLTRLDAWFCRGEDDDRYSAQAYALKAANHARLGDHAAALTAIDRAIGMDADPAESWYQLKLASHRQLGQDRAAANTLESMVGRWPERETYWLQLAGTWYQLRDDGKALAVLALANRRAALDDAGDILFLSELYRRVGAPFQAARTLEDGIGRGAVEARPENHSLLGDIWYQADELEKSLAAYEAAGEAAGDGNADLRRAFILVELERWAEAEEALDRSLHKGGLDERQNGEAYLLRGMARFHLDRPDEAGADWRQAARQEATRESAQQWIKHLRELRGQGASS